MWALIRGEPDTVIRCASTLILGGLALGAISGRFALPCVVTSVYAVALGASGGSLSRWRVDCGLWMLAVVFLVVYCVVYGAIAIGQFGDVFRLAARPGFPIIIDVSIGTSLLVSNIRFLVRVIRGNLEMSRR